MIWRGYLLFAAIAIAVLLIISACAGALWLVDASGQSLITRLERDSATTELELYVELRREEGAAALVRAIARHARIAGEHHIVAVADARGHLLAGDLSAWPVLASANLAWAAVPTTEGPNAIHAAVRTLPDGMRLLVGRDDSMHQAFADAVLQVAKLAIFIVALACLLAPGALIAISVRNVRELSHTAELIAAGQFGARTPTHGGSGPFETIARSQNAMLDRIEDLVTGLKTVTDSLAHDLRTPLARLRSTLERGITTQSEAEKQAALESALAETERTTSAFSSLIDIARAEGGLSRDAMTRVDLAALMRDVRELFLPLAEEHEVELHLKEPQQEVILGHKPLLMQAVSNLVHNAIKYSPHGAQLSMELTRSGDEVRIVIADRGPGIPADKRVQAVRRFQRLGPEGEPPEGVGLGLAIVEACAHLHRGTLLLEDNQPGLRAALVLHA
ncbi:MAG: hypothetical protein JSS00_08165 [Proteobacteria bacterium]|nr:hypothetical protein [Pseudomonadota bacterium]